MHRSDAGTEADSRECGTPIAVTIIAKSGKGVMYVEGN